MYRYQSEYRQVLAYPLNKTVIDLESVCSMPELPLVIAARATETWQKSESFFKAPVWRAEGQTVVAFDLRFRFPALGNDWDPLGFCFQLEGNRLAPVDESLGTYLTNWRKRIA